jgi:organic radical activating enzyme
MNPKLKSNYCPYVEKGFRAHIGFYKGKILSTFKPCCNMHRDLLDPEQQDFLEIDENNIEEYLHNRHRKYFQNFFKTHDTLHKACQSCELTEKSGNISERQKSIQDDEDYYDIYKLNFTLSNICNLACPFCSADASSLIDKTAQKYDDNERPFSWKPQLQDYNLTTDKASKLLSELLKKNKVKYLKIVGGEPFLKGNWETIQFLLDGGYLKDTTLQIVTNGTCVSKEKLRLLENAKAVDLNISMDSIYKNYDFIRWPSSWNNMTKKIDNLSNDTADNTFVSYSSLLNIFNFELVPQIRDHMLSRGLDVNFEPDLKPSNSPLHIRNLPTAIIEEVLTQLSKNSASYIKEYCYKSNLCTKDKIIHDVKFFLSQRNMPLNEVVGEKTYNWLKNLGI